MSDTATVVATAAPSDDPAVARREYLRGVDDHELLVVIADNLITMREGIEGAMEALSNVPFLKGRF